MKAIDKKSFIDNVDAIVEEVATSVDKAIVAWPKTKGVVIMSLDEYNSREETFYLMNMRANYDAIMHSRQQAKDGLLIEVDDNFQPVQK